METKPFNVKEALQHPERIVDLSGDAYRALDINVDVNYGQYPIVIVWSDGRGIHYTLDGREDTTDVEPSIAMRGAETELNQKLIPFDLDLAKTGMYEVRTRDGNLVSEWHHFSEVIAGNNSIAYVTRGGYLYTVSEDGLGKASDNDPQDLMLVQ